MRASHLLVVFLFFVPFFASAQATLFAEDFNSCLLGPGWNVNIEGNQNAVWYVGECQNNDQTGGTMDGTCFLFIDDDASGDNTPPFVIDIASPTFDASQFPNIELQLDVHYRDWGSGEEYFQLLITDGADTIPLQTFSGWEGHTGDSIWQYETLKYDLSVLTQSNQVRLIIRYDDAGAFNWWAGVDNISVVGYGAGENVVVESFNDCVMPPDWSSQVVTGEQDWVIGFAQQGGGSMNGSCFAYFDDDILGASAPYSTARLNTPWFDGSQYGEYVINFDLIHRYYSEIISLIVQHGNGDEFIVSELNSDFGGPNFYDYQHATVDLTPYRNQQMRVVFQYFDGNDWGWWSGIDNVKITGFGAANDLCDHALEISANAPCVEGGIQNAIFEGPIPACGEKPTGALWYKWQADFSGSAIFHTNAQFNDVVGVFTGGCAALNSIVCDNYDEHGFIGENTRFEAVAGTSYLIRVSGQEAQFGAERGSMCVSLTPGGTPPTPPANDNCASATSLVLDANCTAGTNKFAGNPTILPSANQLARADVWYAFTAPALATNEVLEITSGADFSDIITVYQGGCGALTEVASNHEGGQLDLASLQSGQTYRIQIAGNFATVEGNLCVKVRKKQVQIPANDQCSNATTITLGSACLAANNMFAGFSGIQPPCVPTVNRDIWYKFVAPTSGAVKINTGARFEHVAAVWSGPCDNMQIVGCLENPLPCEGFVTIGELIPGQTYRLQIASWNGAGGANGGDLCIQVLDAAMADPFTPIALNVQAICSDFGIVTMHVTAQGGLAPLVFEGVADGETLPSGTSYLVVVTDAQGCQRAITGLTQECTSGCFINTSASVTTPICGGNPGTVTAFATGGTAPYQYAWSNGVTTAANPNLAAGVYTVTITDAAGCQSVSTATLTANPALTASVAGIVQPGVGQSNGAVQINTSGGGGVLTFAWYLNGNVVGEQQNLTNVPAGTYTLVVADAAGCTASLTIELTEIVGTHAINDLVTISLLPNPASRISVLSLHLNESAEIDLFLQNSAGQTLQSWSLGEGVQMQHSIDVGSLPSGVYWVMVRSRHFNRMIKLVVAR